MQFMNSSANHLKKKKIHKLTYEDKSDAIDEEIRKRSKSWFLTSVPWIDFEDVSQIIRTHIFKKWEQWDQARALQPWLNRLISNQLKNILRNYYSNFARPCLNCPFSSKDCTNSCSFTPSKTQSSECPLYKKWEKTKKDAYNIKIPVPLSGDESLAIMGKIASTDSGGGFDMEAGITKLSLLLKRDLTKKQYQVFDLLYIQNLSDEEAATKMGYTTTEKNRALGYKQMKNMKKVIRDRAKKLLEKNDIFY
jgi:DNA-directed RNA polymerase specialized sigma24 family protein|tara:strand:+ start:82 stop:831 length:750 start_codon:yes stop_codon:yes gene_type:complete